MIVWGGYDFVHRFNTGGRYNPDTDSWTATTTNNAPTGRYLHTAVWTGSEMIVWGGFSSIGLNTGGRYNPSTNSWTATSTANAPTARGQHTAVWTDGEMIVWGGLDSSGAPLKSGGRYNPDTDSWTATSTNAPSARYDHTAVWTSSEMIVWGGIDENFVDVNTGGRYCAQAGLPTPTPTPTVTPTPTATPTATPTPTPTPAQITLSAEGRKVNGVDTVRLTWSGATSSQVDIYRCVQQLNGCNPAVIATAPNVGSYIDSTGHTGPADVRYRVCEAGTQTCSKTAGVIFRN